MEYNIIFHKRYAFTFYCMFYDQYRFTFYFIRSVKGFNNLFYIVPITFYHVPSKRLEFFVNTVYIKTFAIATSCLKTVFVKDRHKIIQMIERSRHCGFPYLTFSYLTVAHDLSLIHISEPTRLG